MSSRHSRRSTSKIPTFYTTEEKQSQGSDVVTELSSRNKGFAPIPVTPPLDNDRIAQQRIDEFLSEDEYEDELSRRATWQKIVTHKTPTIVSPSPVSSAVATDTPPSTRLPQAPPPAPSPASAEAVRRTLLPHPIQKTPDRAGRGFSFVPRLSAWVMALVILMLLFGGAFGIFVSLGRSVTPQITANTMSLQVTPATVVPGGKITLRGSYFSPDGQIGLTRDGTIPLLDTTDKSIVRADRSGSFQDSVSIDGSWTSGSHIIKAEDARLHKSASFTIQVNGYGISQRPPHLLLNVQSVDLGSGDQATNATKAITLSDGGGGQISWQATVTQPSWLLVSPASGTFSGGQQIPVTLAADRSNLKVGNYAAEVIFTSNAGKLVLSVQMQVTPLLASHEAVLQATPAALNFTAVDGGSSPSNQVVTVSNPGVLPLSWSANGTTTDGNNWLSVSPASGVITRGSSQPVTVMVDSSMLLPGVYYGSITFSSQGSETVQNSPETIYINVTIEPQCSIQVTPGALTFTSVYLQPGPAAKAISIGMNQSCSAPLAWNVGVSTNNGGSWLSTSAASGSTPALPTVGVAVKGLQPGTYTGQLVFSSAAGTETIPVTLVMGKPTAPIMTSSAAVLNVSGISGQPAPNPQTVVVSNTGGGSLAWNATVTTAMGGAWLSVVPATGVLTAQQTTNLSVKAVVLPGMIPGVYTGTITLSGTDGAGHVAAGSPQSIPVTFTVQAPCTIAASAPALTFQGVAGQPAPATQAETISASGACANDLDWTASVATNPAGGTWLTAAPASGTVTLDATSSTAVGVVLSGLAAGTYTGSVTIAATDSVTHQAVGAPQVVTITLNVQPPCTLQTPSAATETFSSEAGTNPANQTFTIGIVGACSGSVTITPTVTTASGGAWLTFSPASATIASGKSATFTVSVTSAGLAAGTYQGALSLAALDGGIAIAGSPQSIAVNLTVLAPPALAATPATLTFTQATGSSTQTIRIKNTGGTPLKWKAALASGAPAYVTISSATSGRLAAGASRTIKITVDTTGLAGGTTVTTSVTISAIDPATGAAVAGSPASVSISITPPPPAMQLSATTLTFSTTAGTDPAPQTITLTNSGGNGLTWTVGAPSQPWLVVTPTSGSDDAGASSTLTFTVTTTGLLPGTYSATVTITPSSGAPQTVTVNLTVG